VSDIPDIPVRDCELAEIVFRSLSIKFALSGAFDIGDASLNAHRALTRGVISWLCDSKRKSNIYLINNKPCMTNQLSEEYSRAAVVGKICSDAQRLVSTDLKHYEACANIDQLSAELAAAYPPYRHMLTRTLIDYPEIHRLPQRARFKKFILEPWKAVQHRHPEYITAPPVIILECYKSSHEDPFRLICEFGSPPHSSPLLWVISVGPKFKLPIQDLVEPFAPRYIRPPVCYNEAPADARLVFHDKFGALRRKYKQTFDDNEVRPSDEQMAQLVRVVLGVFKFVDVIIQFVDWNRDGGPRAHLETFLGYMADSPQPSDEQPYSALDHFYIHALSNIPPDVFLDVKNAFSNIRWQPLYLDLVQLLGLIPLGSTHFFRAFTA
jgi:hypothetical protein